LLPRAAGYNADMTGTNDSPGHVSAPGELPEAGGGLDGLWQVERTGGLLPPLYGVQKRIAGGSGWTTIGRLPGAPFDVRGLELRYRGPLRGLVDVLAPDGPDAYAGRSTFAGRTFGTFRMTRVAPATAA
jgi:hypothetical protein